MDEIFEILLRLIAGLFENKSPRQSPAQSQRVAGTAARPNTPPGINLPHRANTPHAYTGAPARPTGNLPPNRVVFAPAKAPAKPPARRSGVRAASRLKSVAIAQPIITALEPMPAPAVNAPMPPMTITRPTSAKPVQPAGNAVPAQSADSIRKWMSPATLKQQFLLTEILQPPLALRDLRAGLFTADARRR